MAATSEQETLNRVHEDQNWRQRIESEVQATEDWYEFYGFLAADSGLDPSIKEELLNKARRGPLHKFMVDYHRQNGGVGEAPMKLSKEMADSMRAYVKHGLGWSLNRNGIPPPRKYTTPVTSSQTIGWQAAIYGSIERLGPELPDETDAQ